MNSGMFQQIGKIVWLMVYGGLAGTGANHYRWYFRFMISQIDNVLSTLDKILKPQNGPDLRTTPQST